MKRQIAVLSVALCLSAVSRAQVSPVKARIKIDTDRAIGQIHPHLFGNFSEHLGRCIYGGIYEPGSPLSDEEGYRKDEMEAARALGLRVQVGSDRRK